MNCERQYLVFKKWKETRSIFADIKTFARYHPLIKHVTFLKKDVKGFDVYNVKEQPFSWLPFILRYKAEVESHPNYIEYRFIGIPILEKIEFRFEEMSDSKTRIHYLIEVRNVYIVTTIFMRIMLKAHDRLIRNINED